MSTSQFYGYVNIVAMAGCYCMLFIAPSWGWCAAACTSTTAWYYHYQSATFIRMLIDEGIIKVDYSG